VYVSSTGISGLDGRKASKSQGGSTCTDSNTAAVYLVNEIVIR